MVAQLAREIQSLVPRVQGERPALPRARWGPQIQINPRAHHIGPLERGTPPILPGQSHGGEPAFYVKRGKPSRGPVRGPPGGEEHYVQTRTCLSGWVDEFGDSPGTMLQVSHGAELELL
jgi:hypothetical protein